MRTRSSAGSVSDVPEAVAVKPVGACCVVEARGVEFVVLVVRPGGGRVVRAPSAITALVRRSVIPERDIVVRARAAIAALAE